MTRYKFPWMARGANSPTSSRSLTNVFEDNTSHQEQAPCLVQGSDLEKDKLSASVNIEDIIENYDEASHKSRSASILSFLQSARISQSYFSLSGTKDDETSFYSAQPDGFSLEDEYVLANDSSLFSHDPLWARDPNESENMTRREDFQVNWYDVNYEIKPQISITSLWNSLEFALSKSLSATREVLTCHKTGQCNTNNNQQNQHSTKESGCSKDSIRILQHVSGSFKSGQLTAILGPSGAGKTSLLNFLSRRREEGFSGQLYLDNANHRIKINAIPQEDHLPEYLSVRENLDYASRMKNTHPEYEHEKTIERVSRALGLDDCLETRTKNISGGQLKRLAIAQELLSKPDILILDEPTSGLDSLTCFKTLSVLKDLVKSSENKLIDPIAIVLTIHQPQQDVFDLFDKVYVMAIGGIVIYDGPPDKCVEFVERYAGIKMPNLDYNPASFIIEIASGEYGQEPIDAMARQVIIEFEAKREKIESKLFKKLQAKISSNANNDNTSSPSWISGRNAPYIDSMIAKASSMSEGGFWRKTGILAKRCWISIIRDPKQLVARIIFHLILPLGLALMMGTEPGKANACPKYKPVIHLKELVQDNSLTSSAVQNEYSFTLENLGTFFVLIYALVSANVAATTLSFTLDIQNSLKEYYNGWYTMPSYILARLATNAPMDFLLPMMAVAIGYMTTGQDTGTNPDKMPDAYRIIMTALAVSLGSMSGQLMGMICGAIYIGHVTTALFVSQGLSLPLCLISGFVVRAKSLPSVVRALSSFSFYRHTMEITYLLRWGYNVCTCNYKITGDDVKIVGISEEMRKFIKSWISTQQENEDPPQTNTTTLAMVGNTTLASQLDDIPAKSDPDIFDIISKQISLFNTYGLEIKSCDDIKPFQLTDFQVSESDLVPSFLKLIAIWAFMMFLLMITVKLVIHFRTSL